MKLTLDIPEDRPKGEVRIQVVVPDSNGHGPAPSVSANVVQGGMRIAGVRVGCTVHGAEEVNDAPVASSRKKAPVRRRKKT